MKVLGCFLALFALLTLFSAVVAGLLSLVSGPVAVIALSIALCTLVLGTHLMTEGEIHDDL
jgi:hypothetical protein